MNVLFLCKSNVTRSQIAEAFFNKYSKIDNAESSAIIKPQEKMHRLVVRAMNEKGIDISKNISKKVTKKMINEADIIILMNPDLKNLIKINKKVKIWNIPDVISREEDEHIYSEFVKIREMIEEKVKELLIRISR